MKNIIMVLVATFAIIFIYLAEWTNAYKRGSYNICPTGQLLKTNGHAFKCRSFKKNCPDGYYCHYFRCCPIVVLTSTTTTPTPVICTPPPECPEGSIIVDDMGCLSCIYPCPRNLCSQNEFCLTKFYQTNMGENIPLGQSCISSPPNCPDGIILDDTSGCPKCYSNPCADGNSLREIDGSVHVCDIHIQESCPSDYTCTSTETNQDVCCSKDISTTPMSTTCPPVEDCTGGILENHSGCEVCVHPDSCPTYPCPDDLYCLSTKYYVSEDKYILVGKCISNPCVLGKPFEENGTFICNPNSNEYWCPHNYLCTSVETNTRVCCLTEISTISTSTSF